MQCVEMGALENHIGRIGEQPAALHLYPQRLAHRTLATIASHQVWCHHGAHLTCFQIFDGRAHRVGALHELDQFGLMTSHEPGLRAGEFLQDRVEKVLRTTLSFLWTLRGRELRIHAGHGLAAQLMALQGGEVDVVLGIIAIVSRRFDVVHNAPFAAKLHGSNAHQVHFGLKN